MFTTAVKYLGTKPKPAVKALEPRFRPEQNQTITRAIFEILKEHGPLSVAQTWERVQVCYLHNTFDAVKKIVK